MPRRRRFLSFSSDGGYQRYQDDRDDYHNDRDDYDNERYDRYADNDSDDYDNDRYDRYLNFVEYKSSNFKSTYKESFNSIPINITSSIKNYYTNYDNINLTLSNLNNNNENILEDTNLINLDYIITNIKIKYIQNKHDYLTKKRIFTLINDSGAGIFGGSLRDSILHDFGSNKFYQYFNHNLINYNNLNILYTNKNYHKESYIDRNTIFNDIDTVMNKNNFKLLLSKLEDFEIKYNYCIHHNFNEYIDIIDVENLISSYIVLNITIDNPFRNDFKLLRMFGIGIEFPLKESFIKVDILMCKETLSVKNVIDKITSNSDFYCNSLYLFNNKLQINEDISKKLKNIEFNSTYEDNIKKNIDIFLKKEIYMKDIVNIVKNQILKKIAFSINLTKKNEKRITKIKNKGFTIKFNQSIYDNLNYHNVICKNEICILCRSDLFDPNENDINNYEIKLKCCSSFYHKECLLEITKTNINFNKCFYCSNKLDYKFLSECLTSNFNI